MTITVNKGAKLAQQSNNPGSWRHCGRDLANLDPDSMWKRVTVNMEYFCTAVLKCASQCWGGGRVQRSALR